MAENTVLYRRWPSGQLVQYVFGGRSAYTYLIDQHGHRRLKRHATVTDMADAIRHLTSGTPVDPKDVPAEPDLVERATGSLSGHA